MALKIRTDGSKGAGIIIPTEIWFDNTSTIVTRILKNGGRELTDKFLRFSEHYGFSYRFMNPESDWEKGNVENKVGYSRRKKHASWSWIRIPHFTSLYDFNQNLLAEADADMDREHYHYDQTILKRYDADRKALLPLPDTAFDTARYETVVTDKWGRFTLESGKHEYSVSPDHSETTVMLKITANQVMVMDMKQRPTLGVWSTTLNYLIPMTLSIVYNNSYRLSVQPTSHLLPITVTLLYVLFGLAWILRLLCISRNQPCLPFYHCAF